VPLQSVRNSVNKVVRVRRLGTYFHRGQVRFQGTPPARGSWSSSLREFPTARWDDGPGRAGEIGDPRPGAAGQRGMNPVLQPDQGLVATGDYRTLVVTPPANVPADRNGPGPRRGRHVPPDLRAVRFRATA